MATMMQPQKPEFGEIAPAEDPLKPLRLTSLAAAPFATLLQPEDSILRTKGGIENLRIYKELLRDDQVASTWQQRRLSLTSCDTEVEPGAEDELSKAAAEELKAQLDAMNWDDITDKSLFGVFYGWNVAEVIWRPGPQFVTFDRIVVRDRSRFRFDRDGNLYLWTNGSGWRLMPDRKFWTYSAGADNHDEPYGLGLAHSLYWPVFFKRNDIKFWLIFLEKFGMPTAKATVPAGQMDDPTTIDRAKAVLQQIATDAGVVVPDNVVIELIEAARSGNVDYGGLHDAMNAAISKIVVGQTMTTDNGSSRAQAQVHEKVAESIMQADSDLLCGSFNNGPVKWWTEWNFPGAAVPKVYRKTEAPEDANARAERDSKVYGLGFEPSEEYVQEHYGEGWTKKQAPAVNPLAGLFGQNPGQNPGQAPGNADQAQFAEGELAALAALKAARRGDQQALAEAATTFAEQYDTIMGRRIEQVLQAAEFAEDFQTFRERLDEILAEAPPPETVDKLTRGSLFARMMGAVRAKLA